MNTADYLTKLERDMTGGFLHLLLLYHLDRDEPIHGYGLIKAMAKSTRDGLWKEGTIYPILGALEKEGLIRSRWGKGGTGPRRKYYQMTPAGKQVLRLGIQQWNDLRDNMDTLLENGT